MNKGKSKRKRQPSKNIEPKPKKVRSYDDDEEETASDSGSEKTGNNKHRPNQRTTSTKSDTWRGRRIIEVESIISNKQFKGKTKYLLKWKDGGETWETKKKTTKLCPAMLCQYIEEAKKAFLDQVSDQVERPVQGETWETECRAKQLCPDLVTLYEQETEIANRKAMEVEAIVEHKLEHRKPKYLIKWKDHTKGETWETARKTISVCPDILDDYMKDKPDAVPPMGSFNPYCWWYKETKDRPKRRRHLFGPNKLSDEEDDEESDDEDAEWEVERIIKHRIKENEDWDFLIRWKGCTANDDTWEVEENLNCPDILLKYLGDVADGTGNDRRPAKKGTGRNSKTAGKKKKR